MTAVKLESAALHPTVDYLLSVVEKSAKSLKQSTCECQATNSGTTYNCHTKTQKKDQQSSYYNR